MTARAHRNDGRKEALHAALSVVADVRIQDIAERAGVALASLYAYRDLGGDHRPARPQRPSPDLLRRIAEVLREDAGRIMAAATALDRAADRAEA